MKRRYQVTCATCRKPILVPKRNNAWLAAPGQHWNQCLACFAARRSIIELDIRRNCIKAARE